MPDFDRLAFWADPSKEDPDIMQLNDGRLYRYCQPEFYFKSDWGIKIAMGTLPRYAEKKWSFLEIGCNTGHTLAELVKAGYKNVSGIEINRKAIDLGRRNLPELRGVPILCAPLEDVIRDIEPVDVIFGTGVLMHLPFELDWVLDAMAMKARRVILTSENEFDTDSFFKWGRNYKAIFEALGWVQVEEETGDHYPPLPATTIKRVFLKEPL